MIFYTALIIVYFIHIINYIKLNPQRKLEEQIEKAPKDSEEVITENKEDETSEALVEERELSEKDLSILNSHLAQDNDLLLENNKEDKQDLTN